MGERGRRGVSAVTQQCPCGDTHLVTAAIARRLIPVLCRYGSWYVPGVFAVVHGVASDMLRDAAARYGFEPVIA